MSGGTVHFLHKDFGSSVFAALGKYSKSGNTYFAAVPATEHINILVKFTCSCRYAVTYDFLMCVCTQTQKRGAVCASVRGGGDTKGMHQHLPASGISPNIYVLILVKYLVVLEQLKSEMLKT